MNWLQFCSWLHACACVHAHLSINVDISLWRPCVYVCTFCTVCIWVGSCNTCGCVCMYEFCVKLRFNSTFPWDIQFERNSIEQDGCVWNLKSVAHISAKVSLVFRIAAFCRIFTSTSTLCISSYIYVIHNFSYSYLRITAGRHVWQWLMIWNHLC